MISKLPESGSLKNHFLIAMPTLEDPNFAHAVAYIYEHDKDGAMGVIINKPLNITLADIMSQLEIPILNKKIGEHPVVLGGPVSQEQGFIIHQTSTTELQDPTDKSQHITISASKELLQTLAQGQGPKQILITLGYAGWAAGQMEHEIIADNSWLIAPAEPKILFETPFQNRWREAAALIGVDFGRLSGDVGHA